MLKLDLSQLMKVYEKKYKMFFQNSIKQRKNIDGQGGYSPLGAWADKVKPKRNKNSRLNPPGSTFPQEAIVVTSTPISITMVGNQAAKSRKGTDYNSVIQYNNRLTSYTNKNIDNPPLIFPNTEADFENMPITREFYKDLQKTVNIQLGDISKEFTLPKTIKIG